MWHYGGLKDMILSALYALTWPFRRLVWCVWFGHDVGGWYCDAHDRDGLYGHTPHCCDAVEQECDRCGARRPELRG